MSVADIQSVIDLVGETVTLRREPATDVVVKAKIINYEPTELAGNIIQGRAVARISDAEIAAAAWPGPPQQGDKIIRDGKVLHIESRETRNWFEDGAVHILQLRG
jgi:hypothetical protein